MDFHPCSTGFLTVFVLHPAALDQTVFAFAQGAGLIENRDRIHSGILLSSRLGREANSHIYSRFGDHKPLIYTADLLMLQEMRMETR
jgi:hypothetical protein